MKLGKARVFIVDDHPLVREWLTTLIQRQSDLMVCGEADDAAAPLADSAVPAEAVNSISAQFGKQLD